MAAAWPDAAALPGFKPATLAFMAACHALALRILAALALALGLEESHFGREMDPGDDDNGSALFYNRYPPLPAAAALPAGAQRVWAHTDFEVLTLLFQSAPGLEICPGAGVASAADAALAADCSWTDVDPLPGGITCNIGDALQYWTGGRLKSTYHRVRVPRPGEPAGERCSLAYFANAGLATPLQPPGGGGGGGAVTFLEMLARRAQEVPLAADPATGGVRVECLAGKAGGPDFAFAQPGHG